MPQAFLTALKLTGRLDASKAGQKLWRCWQALLGLAGLAGVPGVLWATFVPASPSLLPSALTLAVGCGAAAADAAGRLPAALRGAWAAASAWTATALFMLQPISQLVVNFTDPASLQGLSLATILLAGGGNALMVRERCAPAAASAATACCQGSPGLPAGPSGKRNSGAVLCAAPP